MLIRIDTGMHMKVQEKTLSEAAKEIGISSITLKRWLLSGKVVEVARDRNGWRIFTNEDIERIKRYANQRIEPGGNK
jgi:predicted site-specific integrase-resolvase